MAAQQQVSVTPSKLSSFGLADSGKEFPTESQDAGTQSRTVAVGKRGQAGQKGGAQELDSNLESDSDSLDASNEGDEETLDETLDDGLEAQDGNEENQDQNQEVHEDGTQKKPREDKRTRKQLQKALAKQADETANLQRQIDAINARQNAPQHQTQTRQEESNQEDELESLLEDGKPGTELLSKDDLKARGDRKKKLESFVSKRTGQELARFNQEELQELYALPGAKELVEWGNKTGAIEKVKSSHRFTAAKTFSLLQMKHQGELKGKDLQIANLNKKIRDMNLGEIPPSSMGSRGNRGTGQQLGNGAPRNALQSGWEKLKAGINS